MTKLQLLYNLQKKHMASTVAELMEIRKSWSRKVSVSENADEEISEVEKRHFSKKEKLRKIASETTRFPKKIIPKFIKEIEDILA